MFWKVDSRLERLVVSLGVPTHSRFPVAARLSVKQFMANNEMNPKLIAQVVRANRELGNLRAVLNSNRPVSLIR